METIATCSRNLSKVLKLDTCLWFMSSWPLANYEMGNLMGNRKIFKILLKCDQKDKNLSTIKVSSFWSLLDYLIEKTSITHENERLWSLN